jgi:hypothetical protein
MGSASTVPPLFPRFGSVYTQPPHRKEGPTNGPPRPLPPSLPNLYLLWFELQTSRISTLRSRALHRTLVTRRRSRGLSGRAARPPWRNLDRERTISATKRVRFYRVLRSRVLRSYPVIYQPQAIETDQAILCLFQKNSPSSFPKRGLPTRVLLVATRAHLHVMSIVAGEVELLGQTLLIPLPP